MRLLSWNTHSLVGKKEEQIEGEIEAVGSYLSSLCPDVIALQEVNQPRDGEILPLEEGGSCVSCERQRPLRRGNYLVRLLSHMPSDYRGVWLPMKVGYGRWDEGLGFLFRGEMAELRWLTVSKERPYEDWQRRMGLLLRRTGQRTWFCNLHLSWWEDREEPFSEQWRRLSAALPRGEELWLMGDFNGPPHRRGESYDTVAAGGFYDCYALARHREGEATVAHGDLDGWRGRDAEGILRIDQIWCRHPARILSCEVCMNGKDGPLASDHFAVRVEAKEK